VLDDVQADQSLCFVSLIMPLHYFINCMAVDCMVSSSISANFV